MTESLRLHRRWAHAILSAILLTPVIGAAQTSHPRFGLKYSDPPTGSHVVRDAVRNSPLPINKKYEELSEAERAIVRGWYASLAPEDEPPFPLEGTRAIHDQVRKGQEKLLVKGELFLIATVEPDGEVSKVETIGAPSPGMTKYAAAVLLLTKFKPGVCGGRPCRMEFPVRYSFQVE